MPQSLILEDNTILHGTPFGALKDASGEVVFNTGMVGYPEALTDPSYRGQILVLTYPLVGNYGVAVISKLKTQNSKPQLKTKNSVIARSNSSSKGLVQVSNLNQQLVSNLNQQFGDKNTKLTSDILNFPLESDRIQVAGLIVSEYCKEYSHTSALQSLGEWLKAEGVPAIEGINTRALTEKLREKGTMLGRIGELRHPTSGHPKGEIKKYELRIKKETFYDPNKRNLVAEVSCTEPIIYEPALPTTNHQLQTILLYDCGVKLNIIRCLLRRGCRVIRAPWDFQIENQEVRIKNQKFHINGIVISNGPGDPTKCDKTIEQIKFLLLNSKFLIPILGICLGNQILALAAGAKTYKLKYGHRSQNQPVIDELRNQAYITTQNHGYAVDTTTLPSDWIQWFTNLNDGTNEGIRHKTNPWMSVQFHPEANPGPTDTEWIFDYWLDILNSKLKTFS